MREEDDAFICRVTINIGNTAESCTGLCRIPNAGMDSGLKEYYRECPDPMEVLELGEVCDTDALSGLVRLGRVTGEDHIPGTYTCEAEFGLFEDVNPWVAEVYVPKKHVPGYKLVDWEGEQDAVASIETKAPEDEPARLHTVVFSRYIEYHREQMSATVWSADGEYYRLESAVQILAYEDDSPQIYLEFRVRKCEASWWHFHGRMDRGLSNGRFNRSRSPVSNIKSNEKFGMGWMDRSIESDAMRKLRELREWIQN
jgi:hypothetical protein